MPDTGKSSKPGRKIDWKAQQLRSEALRRWKRYREAVKAAKKAEKSERALAEQAA